MSFPESMSSSFVAQGGPWLAKAGPVDFSAAAVDTILYSPSIEDLTAFPDLDMDQASLHDAGEYALDGFLEADADAGVDEDLISAEEEAEVLQASRAARPHRKGDKYDNPTSIYHALHNFGLIRKLTEIILAKTNYPWHLRDEAAQELLVVWSGLTLKPEFQRNQIASYAYRSGRHAVRKLQRELGAAVKLPGALFRAEKPSAFLQAIGAVTNPRDVDEYKDSLELSTDGDQELRSYLVAGALPKDFVLKRLAGLCLTEMQRDAILMVTVDGLQLEEVAERLDQPVSRVKRWLLSITRQMVERNARTDERMDIALRDNTRIS